MNKDTVPSKPLALALLATAQFMVILDASIVNVALPSIQEALDFSPEALSWTVNAYGLMFGGFLLLGGRLADLIGRRRVFMAGMGLFAIASLMGGFSTSELQLVICRGAQGLGAALVSPAALSTISVIFTQAKERNQAFGIWGAVAGAGGALGVLLGGILTQLLGWEWIFFINVPVGLISVLLAPRLLVESRDLGHRAYDVPGAVTITAGLLALVYAIVNGHDAGWGSTQTVGLIAAGTALVGLFAIIELRTQEPLIEFSIFKLKVLRAANIFALVSGTTTLSLFYVVSLYMQQVLGYDAIESGLGILPASFASIASAGIASKLFARVGFKPVLVAGTVLMTLALVWLSQMSETGSYWVDVLGPTLLSGAGLGAVIVTISIAGLTGTDRTNAGLGSGLINTSQQIGRAIGLAIVVSIFTSKATSEVAAGASEAAALADGLGLGTLVLAGLSLLSLLIAIFTMPAPDLKVVPART